MQNSNFGAPRPSRLAGPSWRIAGRLLLVLVSVLGFGALLAAADGMRMASLPVTPLEPLAQTRDLLADGQQEPPVSDGARVRVEGFLRGEPPTRGRFRNYALQKLSITHLEHRVAGSRYSRTRYTDATEQQTPRLWLYVDQLELGVPQPRVEVRLPRLWDGEQLLMPSIRGTVGDAGTIPNNVFEDLTYQNENLGHQHGAVQPGQDWELWTVPNNTRVTVVATARRDNGRTVLEIERGLGCALSPDPWQQMTADARSKALGQLTLAVICLSPLAWKGWKWARRRRLAAST